MAWLNLLSIKRSRTLRCVHSKTHYLIKFETWPREVRSFPFRLGFYFAWNILYETKSCYHLCMHVNVCIGHISFDLRYHFHSMKLNIECCNLLESINLSFFLASWKIQFNWSCGLFINNDMFNTSEVSYWTYWTVNNGCTKKWKQQPDLFP